VLPQPGTTARALFNLTDAPHPLPPAPPGATESLLFSSEAARYHGARKDLRSVATLMPYECVVLGPAGWATYG
jgi:hypothetical protein